MARTEEWINVKEASKILTQNSGHPVSEAYVRRLGNTGKVTIFQVDGRTKLYSKHDISKYTVKPRGDGSVRRLARAPRGTAQREEAVA
jgi:hypothetical protein